MNDKNLTVNRKWELWGEEINGERIPLNNPVDSFFIGTDVEVLAELERLCDEWEIRTGGIIQERYYDSHGRIVHD